MRSGSSATNISSIMSSFKAPPSEPVEYSEYNSSSDGVESAVLPKAAAKSLLESPPFTIRFSVANAATVFSSKLKMGSTYSLMPRAITSHHQARVEKMFQLGPKEKSIGIFLATVASSTRGRLYLVASSKARPTTG